MMVQKRTKVNIFGLCVDKYTFQEAVRFIVDRIEDKKKTLVFTPNLHHAFLLQHDRQLEIAYRNADLVFADGMSIVWLSQLLGESLLERINGTNLMMELLRISNQKEYRVLFLGGNDWMAESFQKRVPLLFPRLVFNFFIPPWRQEFTKQDIEEMTQAVNAFHPDILFVGLGAPKQELFLARSKWKLNMSVGIGVGGSFEYLVGTKIRAWRVLQNVGLEWFFRLIQEPTRLWQRYLVEDLPFFVKALGYVVIQRLRSSL